MIRIMYNRIIGCHCYCYLMCMCRVQCYSTYQKQLVGRQLAPSLVWRYWPWPVPSFSPNVSPRPLCKCMVQWLPSIARLLIWIGPKFNPGGHEYVCHAYCCQRSCAVYGLRVTRQPGWSTCHVVVCVCLRLVQGWLVRVMWPTAIGKCVWFRLG